MAGGFLLLHRDSASGDLGSDLNSWGFFTFLLTQVNYVESKVTLKNEIITIPPGSKIISCRHLAERLSTSKSNVHRQLGFLEKRGTITMEPFGKCTLVRFNNWHRYQAGIQKIHHAENEYRGDFQPKKAGTVEGQSRGQSQNPEISDHEGIRNESDETLGQSNTPTLGRSRDIEETSKQRSNSPNGEYMSKSDEKVSSAVRKLAIMWNENKSQGQHAVRLGSLKSGSTRAVAAGARLKENQDLEHWLGVIKIIAKSDFCNGHGNRSWFANFDFLCRPLTQHKALEGEFNNRQRQRKDPVAAWKPQTEKDSCGNKNSERQSGSAPIRLVPTDILPAQSMPFGSSSKQSQSASLDSLSTPVPTTELQR